MWREDSATGDCDTGIVTAETMGCPRCGSLMRTRTNGQTGEGFLGCSSFPDCKGTRPLMAAGAPASSSGLAATKPRRRPRLSAGGRPRSLPDYVELIVARRIGRDLRPLEGFLVQVSAILIVAFLLWAALTSGLFVKVIEPFAQWYAGQMRSGPTPTLR